MYETEIPTQDSSVNHEWDQPIADCGLTVTAVDISVNDLLHSAPANW